MPPAREGGYSRLEMLPMAERLEHEGRWQEHWYRLAAGFVRGLSVLDVGAGSGYGLDIYRAAGGTMILGIDPLPLAQAVQALPLNVLADRSFDVVTALDVIEHVDDDTAFFLHLRRIAARYIFLSTPNWLHSRCENRYHAREYTPRELAALIRGSPCRVWTSGQDQVPAEKPSGLTALADEPNMAVLIDVT